jgi:regulator of sigma E protease
LGGYVRFIGDEDVASSAADQTKLSADQQKRSFHLRPVYQRFLVVLAGPVANFIMAIAIIAAFYATFGAPSTDTVVTRVVAGSPAERSGVKLGDRLLSLGGREVGNFEEVVRFVTLRPNERIPIVIQRGQQTVATVVDIGVAEERDRFGQSFRVGRIGIHGGIRRYDPLPAIEIIPAASMATVNLTRAMVDGLWQIISGRRSVKDLGGPLKIAQIAGQQASLGALEFIQLVALISINLGFINLLPVPMLDGGHLLFYSIEAVRRRPVSAVAQEWAFRGGLAALLTLLLFTTFNDLGSFGLWDRLGRLIG